MTKLATSGYDFFDIRDSADGSFSFTCLLCWWKKIMKRGRKKVFDHKVLDFVFVFALWSISTHFFCSFFCLLKTISHFALFLKKKCCFPFLIEIFLLFFEHLILMNAINLYRLKFIHNSFLFSSYFLFVILICKGLPVFV